MCKKIKCKKKKCKKKNKKKKNVKKKIKLKIDFVITRMLAGFKSL